MKLQQVETFKPRIHQALVRVLFDVIGRETLIERGIRATGPLQVLGRNFGCRVKLFVRISSHDLSQQVLAAAITVNERSVKEIASQIHCALQRAQRLLIVRAAPTAHAPHPIANLAYLPTCSSKPPISHLDLSIVTKVSRREAEVELRGIDHIRCSARFLVSQNQV